MTKILSRFDWISEELEELKTRNLYRSLRTFQNWKPVRGTWDGREVVLFSGNDYLGLSQHPKVIEAAKAALDTHGVGAKSARLVSGTSDWHTRLEETIARFEGKERALVFSSGYLANLGTISALCGKHDLVIMDKLNHASLVDAARLAEATVRVYPHRNLRYLERILQNARARKIWIVTDSVFSMDGDLAPLNELAAIKNRYGAMLVVDEAHGTGVFGASGRGAAEHFGVEDEIDVHIGTLSKAVGTLGGFVAGKKELIEYLINRARPFIFATALPPAVCAAAVCAFQLMEECPELRRRLWDNTERLRKGLQKINVPVLESLSPIIPILIGDEKKALEAAQGLFEEGFFVPAVRYPAVAKGKARLRVTVSAAHSESEIDWLIAAFKKRI